MGPNTLDSEDFISLPTRFAPTAISCRKLRVDARAPGRQSLDSLWQVSSTMALRFVILSSQLRPGQVFDLASSRMALLKLVAFGNSKGARNNSISAPDRRSFDCRRCLVGAKNAPALYRRARIAYETSLPEPDRGWRKCFPCVRSFTPSLIKPVRLASV
jgi:hypothetical protein